MRWKLKTKKKIIKNLNLIKINLKHSEAANYRLWIALEMNSRNLTSLSCGMVKMLSFELLAWLELVFTGLFGDTLFTIILMLKWEFISEINIAYAFKHFNQHLQRNQAFQFIAVCQDGGDHFFRIVIERWSIWQRKWRREWEFKWK